MKKVLTVAAVVEVATGMTLLIVPLLVVRLLLGAELTGVSIPVARVLGIALLALGVACWPGSTALCAMLTYSAARHALPGLHRGYRRMGRAAVMAGSCPARDSDRASRPRVVAITNAKLTKRTQRTYQN
jgi:hypothetical protein